MSQPPQLKLDLRTGVFIVFILSVFCALVWTISKNITKHGGGDFPPSPPDLRTQWSKKLNTSGINLTCEVGNPDPTVKHFDSKGECLESVCGDGKCCAAGFTYYSPESTAGTRGAWSKCVDQDLSPSGATRTCSDLASNCSEMLPWPGGHKSVGELCPVTCGSCPPDPPPPGGGCYADKPVEFECNESSCEARAGDCGPSWRAHCDGGWPKGPCSKYCCNEGGWARMESGNKDITSTVLPHYQCHSSWYWNSHHGDAPDMWQVPQWVGVTSGAIPDNNENCFSEDTHNCAIPPTAPTS